MTVEIVPPDTLQEITDSLAEEGAAKCCVAECERIAAFVLAQPVCWLHAPLTTHGAQALTQIVSLADATMVELEEQLTREQAAQTAPANGTQPQAT